MTSGGLVKGAIDLTGNLEIMERREEKRREDQMTEIMIWREMSALVALKE